MSEYLRKWNPMSLFANSIPPIKTIESKQSEYKQLIHNANGIKSELNNMWLNYFGN